MNNRAILSLMAVFLSACSATTSASRFDSPGRLLTAEEIDRSGARSAWDALRRSGTNLSFSESTDGQATRVGNRGASSVTLRDGPLIFLDGNRLDDLRQLQSIPASTIGTIRILSGIEGTRVYGTNAGGGVIIIETKTGGPGVS